MVQLTIYSKLLILSSIALYFSTFIACSKGKFEIHIKNYSLSSLNLNKCCLGSTNSSITCPESCKVFMEICLSIYQMNPHRFACDIGEHIILTDVLGNATLNESVKLDYSILVRERWHPDFNILVKIKHGEQPVKGGITILALSSSEKNVQPSSSWITKYLSTPEDKFELQVSFRFSCSKDFYGKQCDAFCKPSADLRGYYNCSSDGKKICHTGYNGSYCDKVVCHKKCVHGTCVGPNQCRCLTGWTGESCDECIPYPGCIHGSCRVDEVTKEPLPLTCHCKQEWGGMFCNIDRNYCSKNKNVCENGGLCQNFGDVTTNQQYRCNCKPGFKGTHCEKFEANCLVRRCLNDGICETNSHDRQSTCICSGSFYGDRCQFNQTSCDDNPCIGDNSRCSQIPGIGFQCECAKGFSGRNCEIDEDECSPKPCLNGGMCIDRVSGFTCVCPVGFSGDRCQVNKNDCQKLSCMNGAKCMDRANRIDCECTPGWTGPMCDTNINECGSNQPCFNNGKCIDTPGSYKCLCKLPWSGRICDLKIMSRSEYPQKKCFINPCRNKGICYLNSNASEFNSEYSDYLKSIGGPYTCKCKPGFMGDSCEFVVTNNGSIIPFSNPPTTIDAFPFPKPLNDRPMTLILLTIIAIGVPTIIVIIVSFFCCGRCHFYVKSKSNFTKNNKNDNIIDRTNIKILNNKLHRNQTILCSPNNEKIPLTITKLNNELSNNNQNVPNYQCSHSKNISNLPLYNYQCHIPSQTSNIFPSIKNHIGSQQKSNFFSLNCHPMDIREENYDYLDKSVLSIRDAEPESQYQKSSLDKMKHDDHFTNSPDLENCDKSNSKISRGSNSEMLCRKNNNNNNNDDMNQDLCSSHNSLLDGLIKQNLRTAVSQQFHQPFVSPISKDKDFDHSGKMLLNSSRMSLNTNPSINIVWPAIDYSLSKRISPIAPNYIRSSSENRAIICNSRSTNNQKLNYNLISHPHFKETSCFFDTNLIYSSIKSVKTDSSIIDDLPNCK